MCVMIERRGGRRQVGHQLDFTDPGTFREAHRSQEDARLSFRPAQQPPGFRAGSEGQYQVEAAGEALRRMRLADANDLFAVIAREDARQKPRKQAGPHDGDVELSHLDALRQSAPAQRHARDAYFARMSL